MPIVSEITISLLTKLAEGIASSMASRLTEPDRCHIRFDEALYIQQHRRTFEWSSYVYMSGDELGKSIDSIHVNLEVLDQNTPTQVVHPLAMVSEGVNVLLLGYPGAGKTTTAKRLLNSLYSPTSDSAWLPDIEIAIVAQCRHVSAQDSLTDLLLRSLGLRVSFSHPDVNAPSDRTQYESNAKTEALLSALESHRVLVIIDGLDELPLAEHSSTISTLRRLLLDAHSSQFFITSRTEVVRPMLQRCRYCRLARLTAEQRNEMASKWLSSRPLAEEFISAALRSPYADSLDRPLNVIALCAVFAAYHELPAQPSQIYQRLVTLHLEQWDRQRDIARGSQYARFGPERKRQFLAAIAFELAHLGAHLPDSALRGAYSAVYTRFALPEAEMTEVVREIESHTGLLVSAGLGAFEFSHKSIQEYLVADHISRSPLVCRRLDKWIHAPDSVAIAMALSAEPESLLLAFVSEFLLLATHDRPSSRFLMQPNAEEQHRFWLRFFGRLVIEHTSWHDLEMLALVVCLFEGLYGWEQHGSEHRAHPWRDDLLESIARCVAGSGISAPLKVWQNELRLTEYKNCFRLDLRYFGEIPTRTLSSVVIGNDLVDRFK
jgi:nucleoside-triphosphatase THEP1